MLTPPPCMIESGLDMRKPPRRLEPVRGRGQPDWEAAIGTIPQDLTGQRFTRWTVVERGAKRATHSYYLCRCDCGEEREIRGSALKGGKSTSCGCLRDELVADRSKTHGKVGSPEYNAWRSMIKRCHVPTTSHYHNYGGRGIKVCERWRESFEDFYADMGDRPGPGYSLDRIDNDGDYEPDNCRWATAKQQLRNTRVTHFLTHGGKTMCIADWAKELGTTPVTICARLRYGWPVERVLSEPVATYTKQDRAYWDQR